MKKIIVILMSMLLSVTIVNAESISFKKSINEAKTSKKEIKKELCDEKHPQELLDTKYEEVKKEVKPSLKAIKDDYDNFSKKNAEKMSKKKFKIAGVDDQTKDLIAEYLGKHRGVLLEKNKKELDSLYIEKITEEILKNYYIKNLTQAVEEIANEWLPTEEKEHYVPFLQKQVLHPKVKDETILMDEMATEYLLKKKEMLLKVYTCLIQTNDIIKKYKVGSINIKYKSNYNFDYIESMESIMQGFFSKGNADKQKDKIKTLYNEVSRDIKKLIENSTGIQ